MEAKKLAGLEPAAVFGYFEEICGIPMVPAIPK